VYGKAFSAFGRELDMMTQDSLRFYKSHAVYPQFGGVVFDKEEGQRIAQHLGDGKAIILQNHGLLTVGETIDAAAFWVSHCVRVLIGRLLICSLQFISLDKTW
jgi:ribulose-5-phosphate 4-epimerase/fuculose-1-phosphate aldolase